MQIIMLFTVVEVAAFFLLFTWVNVAYSMFVLKAGQVICEDVKKNAEPEVQHRAQSYVPYVSVLAL